jgi:hypothetical protein
LLDQERRIARGMSLMLDDPDLRAILRNLCHLGGQVGNEAEQVQRYLLGDVRRYQRGDGAFPRASDSRSLTVAAQRAVP